MIAALCIGPLRPLFSELLRISTSREAWTTVADVVIVFYVVYRALLLVRGTRGAQTLAGMALIIALFFAARRMELVAVSWVFEKLIDSFIIFFVVIFQQDLRRALMQVGQNLFMRQKYEETYVIEEVVQAAVELAKQHIGALIVIERDADLSEHLGEVGIELDAKVTKELLVTLFIPERQNHMHDGAVIIRNLRVQQAAAVLPLSASTKLDKELGTRHRAAIGVTEETDSVVVVVSEERGAVSLCFSGNIARDLDAATLRKALLGLFQKKKSKGKPGAQAPRKRGSAEMTPLPTAIPSEVRRETSDGKTPMPTELLPLFTTQPMLRPPAPGEPILSPPEGQSSPSDAAPAEAATKAASPPTADQAAPASPEAVPETRQRGGEVTQKLAALPEPEPTTEQTLEAKPEIAPPKPAAESTAKEER